LLGYFDGDGFVTWSRTGPYVYPRWGLCGMKPFLTEATRIVARETGVAPRAVRSRKGEKMHVLYVSGADAFVVDRWLHSERGLGLTRKRLTIPPSVVKPAG